MKLKFINLLLAAFLLIGSAQALTSCKDTDEDLYAQLRDDNLTLQKNLDAELAVLKGQITALETLTNGLQSQINTLEASLNDYAKKEDLNDYVKKAEFNKLVDDYIANVSAYKNLKEVLDALKATQDEVTNAHGDYATIADRFVAIEGRLATLEKTLENYATLVSDVETLKNFMNEWQPKLGTIEQNAADALALAQKNEGDIAGLVQTISQLQTLVNNNKTELDNKISALEQKLQTVLDDYVTSADLSDAIAGLATQEALETLAATLRQEAQENMAALELRLQQQINTCIARLNGIDTKIADIKSDITKLQSDLGQAQQDILKNTNDIKALTKSLDSVLVRVFNLENRISNIQLEGTENAVLGYLNTPFGIKSNALMNYMGTNDNSFEISMPNYLEDGQEYNGELVITAADYAMLRECGIEGAVSYAAGATLFSEADGNLGKIYFTLNPANIDLNGKDFTVVNSQNQVIPVELKNLRPSNKVLTQGWSRAAAEATSPNGFYEADATVADGDIPAIRVTIDNGLKAAAKKVLAERSATSLLGLGNALYNQFSGIVPALGIRAAWQESNGDADAPKTIEQSVYSPYGIAAATFKPLSYKFLYGKSFRQIPVPDITKLNNYKVDFSDKGMTITFDPTQYTVPGFEDPFDLKLGVQFTYLNDFTVLDVYAPFYDDNFNFQGYGWITLAVDLNSRDLLESINQQLANEFANINEGLNAQLNTVINALAGQINDMMTNVLTDLETKVNSSIQDILNDLQGEVNGKIDYIVDRISNNGLYTQLQNIVNRFNNVLADPNHYLQPVLLYSVKGASYGMFSNTIALPTQFVGGSAIMLTPTTYTGEIVTPAFKKFVAVTNVYKTTDHSVNAQAGDETCKSLVKAANAQKYMNEVVSGERRTMPFVFEGGQGYTYEIVYQALDYSGVTSTSKYYVAIK